MTDYSTYDFTISDAEFLAASINHKTDQFTLTRQNSEILKVVQDPNDYRKAKAFIQVNRNYGMVPNIGLTPHAPILPRTVTVTRELGSEVLERLNSGNPLPLGLGALPPSTLNLIPKLNELYSLGLETNDLIDMQPTQSITELRFKSTSVAYVGFLKVAILAPVVNA